MSTAGLSRARLARMHEFMAGYVERRELPGLVRVSFGMYNTAEEVDVLAHAATIIERVSLTI